MAKPSPYYTNEKEMQELAQKRDNFQFAEPTTPPKNVVLIAGREGSGKTHLACSMSELGPVYLIDTEYRAGIVAKKFKNVKLALVKNYSELVVAVKHVIKHQAPGTIVIDSGSDLQTFAEIEYLERTQKEKVGMPWNWPEVWRLCNALIDDIRFSQSHHLIITSRVKEEFLNEKATGNIIPRIYSTLPYKADLVLQFAGPSDKEKRLLVSKNGFSDEAVQLPPKSESLPAILRMLSNGTAQEKQPSSTTFRTPAREALGAGQPLRKAS